MADGTLRQHLNWAPAGWRPLPGCLDWGFLRTTVGTVSSNGHGQKRVDASAGCKEDMGEGKVTMQGCGGTLRWALKLKEMLTYFRRMLHICESESMKFQSPHPSCLYFGTLENPSNLQKMPCDHPHPTHSPMCGLNGLWLKLYFAPHSLSFSTHNQFQPLTEFLDSFFMI